MNHPTRASFARTALAACGLFLLTACGSVEKRTFRIDVIDDAEQPLPCLVIVGTEWNGAREGKQFVNVTGDDELKLEVTFESPDVEITVAPMRMSEGQPPEVPKGRTETIELTGYDVKSRTLTPRSAAKQLFILSRSN